MLFTFQFMFKLDAANNMFEGATRKGLVLVAMFNMTFCIMRMQNSFLYRPLGKDAENVPQVIALGGLLISNFMMILNARKENMEANLDSQINGIRKDFELQTILFSLEGSNIIFREKSVRFINQYCESIFTSCDPNFKNFSDSIKDIESQKN